MCNLSLGIGKMLGYVEQIAPMAGEDMHQRAEIAHRFLLLRKALGYDQGFIARLVGISQPNWSAYERGIKLPGWGTMEKLHIATGCPPEWLRQGNVERMPAELLNKIELARREERRRQKKIR